MRVGEEIPGDALLEQVPIALLALHKPAFHGSPIEGDLDRRLELPLLEGLDNIAEGLSDLGPGYGFVVREGREEDYGSSILVVDEPRRLDAVELCP